MRFAKTSKKGKAASPRRSKGDAFEAIHSAARGLHRAGAISKATMREYDELCLEPVKEVTAKDVVRIRQRVKVSQNLFAHYLNTSPSRCRSGDGRKETWRDSREAVACVENMVSTCWPEGSCVYDLGWNARGGAYVRFGSFTDACFLPAAQ